MRRSGLVAILSLAALLAVGCGTVSVEVTSEDDEDKIDVDRTRSTTPDDEAAVTETTAPAAPTTTEVALGALGEGSETTTSTSSTTTTTTAAPAETTTTTSTSTTTTTTRAPIPLEYHQIDYAVFALAGDLEIRMPVSVYETVGFHESGHDGAFQLEVLTITDWSTLASRGRGTGSRTAADIVVPVGEPVLSPIDGTVIRTGSYTLYCDHTDNFIVIEPDGRPAGN